jgi:hypothetical protein
MSTEAWKAYDPNQYNDWLSNNNRRIRNNYPDFDFREDLVAELYSQAGGTQTHQIDVHKLLHPAWYLASKTYSGPLDTVQPMLNKMRLLYQAQIAQLFNSTAVESLSINKEQLKSWLNAEADRAQQGAFSDNQFHKLLLESTQRIRANSLFDATTATEPVDLFNSSVFDVVDALVDPEHPFNTNNDGALALEAKVGSTTVKEVKGVRVGITKNQIFRLILAYKLELFYTMQAVLAEALGAESVSLTVKQKDNKYVPTLHTHNRKINTVPDFKRYIKMLSTVSELTEAELTRELSDIENNSKDAASTVIVQVLLDLEREIVRMCNTKRIDDTLETFGFQDLEAATINTEMDQKLATQRNSDWEDNFIKAFPTFKLFIIEEDSNEWRLFDDFYSYDAVHSIDVVESKHAASSTAIVRLSNVTGRLTTPGLESFVYDTDQVETSLKTIHLKPGTTIMLRMGYGPDYRNLPIVFYGSITDVNPGPVLEIKAQSFGAELLQQMTFDDKDMLLQGKNGHDSLGQVAMTILDKTPGLRHFGRWQVYHDRYSGATSSSTLNSAFKIANFAFLSGIGLGDIGADVLTSLGLENSSTKAFGNAKSIIQGWQENTHPYAMLLNFGNPLYDNIYVNNKKPQYYGLLALLIGGREAINQNAGDFRWAVSNQTTWEALWELALYHGDYIVRPLPYNESANIFGDQSIRNTLYFGPREGMYKAQDDPYNFKNKNSSASKLFEKLYKAELEQDAELSANEVSPLLEFALRTYITPTIDKAYIDAEWSTWSDNQNTQAYFKNVLGKIKDVGRDLIGPAEQEDEQRLMYDLVKATAPATARLANEYVPLVRAEFGTFNPIPMDLRTLFGMLMFNFDPYVYGSTLVADTETQRVKYAVATILNPGLKGKLFGRSGGLTKNQDLIDQAEAAYAQYTQEWITALEEDTQYLIANSNALNLSRAAGEYETFSNLQETAGELGITGAETYRPIVEHHVASSSTNIIQNDIRATSDNMSNKVTVYHPDPKQNTTSPSDWPRDTEHRKVSVLSYELDSNYIREYVTFQKNAGEDMNVVHRAMQKERVGNMFRDVSDPYHYSLPIAQQIADQVLMNQVKPMYQGSLTLTGNPAIRPWHIIHLMDTVNQMDGIVEVEEVVHSLNPETGFTTTIKPNLYASMRHNKSIIDAQLLDYQYKASHWARLLVSIGKTAWRSANTFGTLALIGGVADVIGGSSLAIKTLPKLLVGGSYTWPILLASLEIGAAVGFYTYQQMQMRQYVNSALLFHGNAPIVMTPLHYKNRPYVAGMEGIINFNNDVGTIAYDRLFTNMWEADVLKSFIGETDTLAQ